jgi:general secretion pathway protein K
MRLAPTVWPGRPTARNGFIVVAVLWILGALATLVSIYSVYVTNAATGVGLHEDHLQGEALVSAALELTVYQLAPGTTARPAHGEFKFHSRRASVGVAYQSESARVDLNAAPKELLAGLFLSLGARPDEAQYYADRIIGWRTAPPNGEDRPFPTSTNSRSFLAFRPD